MSYQLFEIPTGYETDLVLVVAPYYCEKFVKEIMGRLQPRKIRFVIDDGARVEEIEKLKKCCGDTDIRIALGGVSGLVHLKCFYIEFVKTEGREQRKRRFHFGSANATEAAFGGRTNAELIASVDLFSAADRNLIDYFSSVINAIETGGGKVEGIECEALRNSPSLLLPTFNVKKLDHVPGFDSWLQRGNLVAKYREPHQFMTVAVTLKKSLPPGRIAKTFAFRQLIQQGDRNVLRFGYTEGQKVSEDDVEEVTPQWKAKYCVWTHLGDWVSDDCFRTFGKTMRSKSSQAREVKVQRLREHADDDVWKNARKQQFLETLEAVWRDLRNEGVDPSHYLDGLADGLADGPNHLLYGTRFENKLAADILAACDQAFCDRYINGYEFPATPRFRQDTTAWENFALSWCESILLECAKASTSSLLAKLVFEFTESREFSLEDRTAEDLLRFVRKYWNKKAYSDHQGTVGEWIEAYFKPE